MLDHTCQSGFNTGVQQLTRNTFTSFLNNSCDVVPVKWNVKRACFQEITGTECQTLLLYCNIDKRHLTALKRVTKGVIIEEIEPLPYVPLLFVPEVTCINRHAVDLTNYIIAEAERLGLQTSFVFYDATPLERPELKLSKAKYISYMEHLGYANFIFPVSDFSKKKLLDFLDNKDVKRKDGQIIQTIHLGCSLQHTSDPSTPFFTSEDFILCVGTIAEHKNQIKLIKAFKLFKEAHPDNSFKLVIAGNIDDPEKFYKDIPKSADIFIMSAPSNEDIVAAYQNCKFTVFPSLMEGFGLPIIESLRFNKPCITANFGAMKEIAQENGCVLTDTRSTEMLVEAIAKFALDPEFLAKKTAEATEREINTWQDYANNITNILNAKATSSHIPPTTDRHKKRILWLGMHKILVKTELARLRALGHEVFNPPYLSDIQEPSAQYDWDCGQESSLSRSVFEKLSKINFFSIEEYPPEVAVILNDHFDVVIITISPLWLSPILKIFKGKVIYRVYGHIRSVTDEFLRLDLPPYVINNADYHFVPHAIEAVADEAAWVRQNETIIPYCLPDDVFGYSDSWVGPQDNNGEVILTCPHIANPFYQEHYKYLKQNFTAYFYRMYGVQLTKIDDPAVVGTLLRHDFLNAFRRSCCYIYTYNDPHVCYLPPIEAMVIGLPVLFQKGCLLDKYFQTTETPGRFSDAEACKGLVSKIRAGDTKLINAIVSKQGQVIDRYKPSKVWDAFDAFFEKVR